MTRIPPYVCAAAALLTACSTPSTPTTPDGRHRISVNSPAAIHAYNASAAPDNKFTGDEAPAAKQLREIRRDVDEMKNHIAALSRRMDDMPPSAAAQARAPLMPPHEHLRSAIGAGRAQLHESVRLGDQAIIFQIMHGPGATGFAPSPRFADALLRAAKAGKQINIRVGSDARNATSANQRVVEARAAQARHYLASNGIPADRMKTTTSVAGAVVASNATPERKARNRRTEIEIAGITPTERRAIAAQFAEVMQ